MSRRARVFYAAVAMLIALTIMLGALIFAGGLPAAGDDASASRVLAFPGPGQRDALRERGAYLARAGDCMACHTVRGGAPNAGGRIIRTAFGELVTPNITPDLATGIGSWSADEFWRALHHGKGKDGRLLYPAFPYTSYTRITRDDADALYAWLRSVPAVRQPNLPHRLRFPYNQQWALAAWRLLYFRPAEYRVDTAQTLAWNRGAYLVQGLGHCSACHSPRNWLGAESDRLSGGMLEGLGWYAPALTFGPGAGAPAWSQHDLAALLKTGVATPTVASGPMAEVVRASLQHLDDADIGAMALYLRSLPAAAAPPPHQRDTGTQAQAFLAAGSRLYDRHCATCHGDNGAGQAPAYPPLAGNRALSGSLDHAATVNSIRIVLNGGFAPSTAGNPRPYGMPPFGPVLSDTEVAQLLSYLRSAWGNHGAPVTATEVNRYRAVPLDQ
ncbi:alcohol dehydrogenase [Duganella sp. Leaf126]|uniref:cytochrome c n=1 Tax=Duganella sp. Leaf126 TaxID=1736266 RepID=UPI0007013850|nr:cytochrome c [Duganella sp. Leaf126]KQQ45756.1 alcohol dehydrogenase [Duganella sp. Leaf126]